MWMLPLTCDARRVEFNNVVDVQHGHKLLFKFSERFRLISVKFVRVVDDHFVHLLAPFIVYANLHIADG